MAPLSLSHPHRIFSASSVRESDVQTGESSLTPDSMQISPRELTRCQGESVRISLKNADPVIVSHRIVGKRTAIFSCILVLSGDRKKTSGGIFW